jgi:hypothetical protein
VVSGTISHLHERNESDDLQSEYGHFVSLRVRALLLAGVEAFLFALARRLEVVTRLAERRVVFAGFEVVVEVQTALVFGVSLLVQLVEVAVVESLVAAPFAFAFEVTNSLRVGSATRQRHREKANGREYPNHGRKEKGFHQSRLPQ